MNYFFGSWESDFNMFFNIKLIIKNYTQVLLRICTGNFNTVVKDTRMCYLIFFLEKITSCAGFLGSGLKSIFQWYAHQEITLRSRFKYLSDSLRSWTRKKSDVSSANNLTMELSPSSRSIKYINSKNVQEWHPVSLGAARGLSAKNNGKILSNFF